MFDSNGKLPSGILSSVWDGCDIKRMTSPNQCGDQPYDDINKIIKIPHGNTVTIYVLNSCAVGDLVLPSLGDLFLASLARGSGPNLSVGMGCGRA